MNRRDVLEANVNAQIHRRVVENFEIVWLDSNNRNSTELRSIVNSIRMFDDIFQFIDYIKQPRVEKLFAIISDIIGPAILSSIHRFTQLQLIYIFGDSRTNNNDLWTRGWNKVKGIFTNITLLQEALRNDVRQCENDLTQITTLNSTNAISNELDQSFMYSQILQEILVDMDHSKNAKADLVKFCREQYAENLTELAIIDEFDRDYSRPLPDDNIEPTRSPIWWYTRECFVYSMLNKALRTLDIEIILKMGFLMQDIHRQIEHLHAICQSRESLVVYRGQGILTSEFEKMQANIGGLLSFSSFLSTSTERHIALGFTYNARKKPDKTALLFKMSIDSSALFARLDTNFSYYKNREKEILFSMNTVFRINRIQPIDLEQNLWEVQLEFTHENDEKLKILTEHLRKDIGNGPGMCRIGALLIKMGQFNKAEDIYNTQLKLTRTNDWLMLAHINNQLGYIFKQKGDLKEALQFYQNTLDIQSKNLSTNDLALATTYINIGAIYDSTQDYSIALNYYQRALVIKQKYLAADDLSLPIIYNNIGLVYNSLGQSDVALTNFFKAVTIQERYLSSNDPSLATTYTNIGKAYSSLEDYPAALNYYEKAHASFTKSLPPNHPSLATANNNIGATYDRMRDSAKALEYYEKTLEIQKLSLPKYHRSLATTHNNIGFVCETMKQLKTALVCFQTALDIEQHCSPVNHENIQELKSKIDSIKRNL